MGNRLGTSYESAFPAMPEELEWDQLDQCVGEVPVRRGERREKVVQEIEEPDAEASCEISVPLDLTEMSMLSQPTEYAIWTPPSELDNSPHLSTYPPMKLKRMIPKNTECSTDCDSPRSISSAPAQVARLGTNVGYGKSKDLVDVIERQDLVIESLMSWVQKLENQSTEHREQLAQQERVNEDIHVFREKLKADFDALKTKAATATTRSNEAPSRIPRPSQKKNPASADAKRASTPHRVMGSGGKNGRSTPRLPSCLPKPATTKAKPSCSPSPQVPAPSTPRGSKSARNACSGTGNASPRCPSPTRSDCPEPSHRRPRAASPNRATSRATSPPRTTSPQRATSPPRATSPGRAVSPTPKALTRCNTSPKQVSAPVKATSDTPRPGHLSARCPSPRASVAKATRSPSPTQQGKGAKATPATKKGLHVSGGTLSFVPRNMPVSPSAPDSQPEPPVAVDDSDPEPEPSQQGDENASLLSPADFPNNPPRSVTPPLLSQHRPIASLRREAELTPRHMEGDSTVAARPGPTYIGRSVTPPHFVAGCLERHVRRLRPESDLSQSEDWTPVRASASTSHTPSAEVPPVMFNSVDHLAAGPPQCVPRWEAPKRNVSPRAMHLLTSGCGRSVALMDATSLTCSPKPPAAMASGTSVPMHVFGSFPPLRLPQSLGPAHMPPGVLSPRNTRIQPGSHDPPPSATSLTASMAPSVSGTPVAGAPLGPPFGTPPSGCPSESPDASPMPMFAVAGGVAREFSMDRPFSVSTEHRRIRDFPVHTSHETHHLCRPMGFPQPCPLRSTLG